VVLQSALGLIVLTTLAYALAEDRAAVPFRQHFRGLAHHQLGNRVQEAVAVHPVGQPLVAHLHSPARAFHQVGHAAHGLHAARQHALGLPAQDALRRQRQRLQPRSAGLVHGKRRNRISQHRSQRPHRHLPRHVRAAARLPGAAQDDFVYLSGFDSGPLQRRSRRHHAQVGGRQLLERPAELAHRRAHGAEDVSGTGHLAEWMPLTGG